MGNTTIRNISVNELKKMSDSEGLILQGCGGEPREWIDGINKTLTDAEILLYGAKFTDVSVFEHNGVTNILFDMDNVKLDVGKLAIWRIQTHSMFGGTWLSDYRHNQLGVSADALEPQKPEAPIISADGNIFSVMGIASRALKAAGLRDEAAEMRSRVTESGSYDNALAIIMEYVEPVDAESFGRTPVWRWARNKDKNSAESLLGDGKSGLGQFALRALNETKEKIQFHAAAPCMSEQEQKDVSQILQNITRAIDQALIRIDDNVLGAVRMNTNNLKINDKLFADGDRVTAYFDTGFDVDRRFGTQTEGTDAYISLCANYYPEDEILSVYYILHDADGTEWDPVSVLDLTAYESETIRQLMIDAGLEECITEMSVPDEDEGMAMT